MEAVPRVKLDENGRPIIAGYSQGTADEFWRVQIRDIVNSGQWTPTLIYDGCCQTIEDAIHSSRRYASDHRYGNLRLVMMSPSSMDYLEHEIGYKYDVNEKKDVRVYDRRVVMHSPWRETRIEASARLSPQTAVMICRNPETQEDAFVLVKLSA